MFNKLLVIAFVLSTSFILQSCGGGSGSSDSPVVNSSDGSSNEDSSNDAGNEDSSNDAGNEDSSNDAGNEDSSNDAGNEDSSNDAGNEDSSNDANSNSNETTGSTNYGYKGNLPVFTKTGAGSFQLEWNVGPENLSDDFSEVYSSIYMTRSGSNPNSTTSQYLIYSFNRNWGEGNYSLDCAKESGLEYICRGAFSDASGNNYSIHDNFYYQYPSITGRQQNVTLAKTRVETIGNASDVIRTHGKAFSIFQFDPDGRITIQSAPSE